MKKFKYQYILNSLKKASPSAIENLSHKKALIALKKAVHDVPFYSNLIEKTDINDISSFQEHVPIINKHTLFEKNSSNIDTIFRHGTIDDINSVLLSSGASGAFSFGLGSPKEINKNTQFLEILLNYFFNTFNEKTLIINCLPVKLNINNIALAEIGPRGDSLLYLIQTLSPKFTQTIIIGDPYFVKNSLEDGLSKNINFDQLKIHLVLGGTYLPESLRTHLSEILHIDIDGTPKSLILSSMGISEFGFNVFFESQEMVNLRRETKKNPELQKKLLKTQIPFLPMFFNYFPQAFFAEEHNNEIILTMLNNDAKLPLIRYNTQDTGKLISYQELKNITKTVNSNSPLLPPFNSPLALLYGKAEHCESKNETIYPQQIQEGLMEDYITAINTTGNFQLKKERNKTRLDIQLKKGVSITAELKTTIKKAALKYINIDLPTSLHPYQNTPFSMELDYERKFQYIL